MPRDDPTDRTADPSERMDETPSRSRYEDWSIGDDRYRDARYVGTTTENVPFFHDRRTIFRGKPDEEKREIVPEPGSERELEPGETIGDVLEEIGDAVGWKSLSEFAAERFPDEPETGDEPASERGAGSDPVRDA